MTQGTALRFPDRQLCLDCGRALGDLVIRGLYCSYWCAGMTRPSDDPQNAPRQCVTGSSSRRRFKKRYRYPGEVLPRNMGEAGASVYECEHCGMYHFGHERHGDERTGSGAKTDGRSLGHATQGSYV